MRPPHATSSFYANKILASTGRTASPLKLLEPLPRNYPSKQTFLFVLGFLGETCVPGLWRAVWGNPELRSYVLAVVFAVIVERRTRYLVTWKKLDTYMSQEARAGLLYWRPSFTRHQGPEHSLYYKFGRWLEIQSPWGLKILAEGIALLRKLLKADLGCLCSNNFYPINFSQFIILELHLSKFDINVFKRNRALCDLHQALKLGICHYDR